MTQVCLPFDILASIADELHQSQDIATLSSLSRSCHSLHPLAQRLLFRQIRLGSVAPDKKRCISQMQRIAEFVDLLKISPHIAKYVRLVNVTLIEGAQNPTESVALALQSLERIEVLQLEVPQVDESETLDTVNWESLIAECPSLNAAVMRVLLEPHFRRLSLHFITDFPITTSTKSAAVLDIEEEQPFCIDISLVERVPSSCHMSDISSVPPRVRNYSVAAAGKWPRKFSELFIDEKLYVNSADSQFGAMDLNALESLAVLWMEAQDKEETGILMNGATSIRSLRCELGGTESFEGLARLIQRNASSTLTSLHVGIIKPSWPFFDRRFQGLCYELVALSGSNALEEISISFAIYSSQWNLDASKLGDLDRALSTSVFPHLRKVTVEVNIWQWQTVGGPSRAVLQEVDLDKRYMECFAGMLGAENVQFSCVAKLQGEWS